MKKPEDQLWLEYFYEIQQSQFFDELEQEAQTSQDVSSVGLTDEDIQKLIEDQVSEIQPRDIDREE